MKPIVVSEILAVGEFPTGEQIAILAKAGFRSIVNNQPDGEVGRFPADAMLSAAAAASGLAYAYAPLSSRTPDNLELDRYRKALAALPAPVYAFCYSGARSAAGAALLMAATVPVAEVLARFEGTGHDMASLRPWLVDAAGSGGNPPQSGTTVAISDLSDGSGAIAEAGIEDVKAVHQVDRLVLPRVASGSGFAM